MSELNLPLGLLGQIDPVTTFEPAELAQSHGTELCIAMAQMHSFDLLEKLAIAHLASNEISTGIPDGTITDMTLFAAQEGLDMLIEAIKEHLDESSAQRRTVMRIYLHTTSLSRAIQIPERDYRDEWRDVRFSPVDTGGVFLSGWSQATNAYMADLFGEEWYRCRSFLEHGSSTSDYLCPTLKS